MNVETAQELAQEVKHRWLLLPNLRLCHVSASKTAIMPLQLFGRGYVFDGKQKRITISRILFGIPVSRSEVRFPDATLLLNSDFGVDRLLNASTLVARAATYVVMTSSIDLYHHGALHAVARFRSSEAAANGLAAAIARLGVSLGRRYSYTAP